jgi:hypothetical protein
MRNTNPKPSSSAMARFLSHQGASVPQKLDPKWPQHGLHTFSEFNMFGFDYDWDYT